MSDQEINQAIAEACGFTDFDNLLAEEIEGVRLWEGRKWHMSKPELNKWILLPSYTTDLNAMHEAWNTLDRNQRIEFSRTLWVMIHKSDGHATSRSDDIAACVENATARQRAEAFLRTVGKWRE